MPLLRSKNKSKERAESAGTLQNITNVTPLVIRRKTRSLTKSMGRIEHLPEPETENNNEADAEIVAKKPRLEQDQKEEKEEVKKNEPIKDDKVEEAPPRLSLPIRLKGVISNLYLNVTERLKLECVPRCAEDLENCYKNHYRAPEPEAPNHTQRENLRALLQNERYISFVNSVTDMAHRREFPGDGIFTKLLELVLSINPKKTKNEGMRHLYTKCIELFNFVVSAFPPCWLSMRHYYVSFFQRGLSADKLKKKDRNPLSKSTKIFEILLDLLETTLEQCSTEELVNQIYVIDNNEAQPMGSPHSSIDHSICSEFNNQWEWEQQERSYQTFEALDSVEKLERLFVALRLMLQILERDLVMWILHHHKNTKDWIFCRENRPLTVLVFDLDMHLRFSSKVRRFFTVFALAVSKDLHRSRLQILERYIALLMVASNTADMENTPNGVKYPYLGAETKKLINDFFKVFKSKNQSKILAYVNTSDLLRIPFVRYEFINHFLNCTRTDDMCPKKVVYDIKKMRWLKYKPHSEIEANSEEDLSREQYLELLLIALQSYCEWHGLQKLFQHWTHNNEIEPFATTTDSVHHWPVQGNGVLMLRKMAKDIIKLEKQLRTTVRMSKPKVDLPLADICIDEEIIINYRNDLKHMVILHDILQKLSANERNDVDFSTWRTFIAQFAPQ